MAAPTAHDQALVASMRTSKKRSQRDVLHLMMCFTSTPKLKDPLKHDRIDSFFFTASLLASQIKSLEWRHPQQSAAYWLAPVGRNIP